MKSRSKPKTKTPAPRHRPAVLFVELGDLHPTLRQIASADALAGHDTPNLSRTVRRLIRDEAERRGITNPSPRP